MKKSKSLCSGCYCDDYNHGLGGAKGCWSFESAEVVKRLMIPVDMRPPYDAGNAKLMMSCYRKQKYCIVKPEVLDSRGFWKS